MDKIHNGVVLLWWNISHILRPLWLIGLASVTSGYKITTVVLTVIVCLISSAPLLSLRTSFIICLAQGASRCLLIRSNLLWHFWKTSCVWCKWKPPCEALDWHSLQMSVTVVAYVLLQARLLPPSLLRRPLTEVLTQKILLVSADGLYFLQQLEVEKKEILAKKRKFKGSKTHLRVTPFI